MGRHGTMGFPVAIGACDHADGSIPASALKVARSLLSLKGSLKVMPIYELAVAGAGSKLRLDFPDDRALQQ